MPEQLVEWTAGIPTGTAETVGTWVAALLTLAVFSYLIGNNGAFRLAEHLFVGVAAGYAAALSWTQVLWPRLELLLREPNTYWYYGVFFVLGLLLLTRGVRSISVLANLPLGVLFGVGAALALGGALTGSLMPQMRASIISISPADHADGAVGWAYAIDALLVMVGTLAVLWAFQFTIRRREGASAALSWLPSLGRGLGRSLIMITFGALVAGFVYAFFSILIGRVDFLLDDWLNLSRTGL